MRRREKRNVFGRFVLTVLFFGLIGIAMIQTFRYEEEKAKCLRYKIEIEDFEKIVSKKSGSWSNEKEKQLNAAKAHIAELEVKLQQNGIVVQEPQSETQSSWNEINSNSNYDEFIKTKFDFDGNYYKDLSTAKFYSDLNCTQEINDSIKFVSAEIDEIELSNGKRVYCLLMDNEELCYTTDYPMIMTEEEFLEHVQYLN